MYALICRPDNLDDPRIAAPSAAQIWYWHLLLLSLVAPFLISSYNPNRLTNTAPRAVCHWVITETYADELAMNPFGWNRI
jgi:hypothetical protein